MYQSMPTLLQLVETDRNSVWLRRRNWRNF